VNSFKLLSAIGEQSAELTPGRVLVVGRAVTSDLPIYDPTVSRKHAELSLTPSGVRVNDLGSSNGTFVNGTRITDTTVGDGDVVTFGKVPFNVVEVTPRRVPRIRVGLPLRRHRPRRRSSGRCPSSR